MGRNIYSRGSILIQYLIGLLVISLLFPIVLTSIRLLKDKHINYQLIQDEIGLYHIRKQLNMCNVTHVSNNEVVLDCYEEEKILKIGQHIYFYKGTVIAINQVDYGCFYVENSVVYLNYIKDDYERVVAIGKIQ